VAVWCGTYLTSRSMAISFSAAAFFTPRVCGALILPQSSLPPTARAGDSTSGFPPGHTADCFTTAGEKSRDLHFQGWLGGSLLIKVCRQINKNNNQNPPKSCAWHLLSSIDRSADFVHVCFVIVDRCHDNRRGCCAGRIVQQVWEVVALVKRSASVVNTVSAKNAHSSAEFT
jgi:hypothetical protein